jgi:hypothetical protein
MRHWFPARKGKEESALGANLADDAAYLVVGEFVTARCIGMTGERAVKVVAVNATEVAAESEFQCYA